MRIAYLTTDEVNEQLALQMATECGITLCPLAPKDAPPDGEYDAVLYDWDYLPVEEQREVMAELLSGLLPHAVALHSYNLEDYQVEALRGNNVAVYRRLQPMLFQSIRQGVIAVRTTKAMGHKPEDEHATSHRDGAA
jgi:hypothetical protein